MATETDTDVLVVGAGPSGLSLATELAMRGHRVQIIERHNDTGVQPRAKTTNVRTMTHMRRWGLAAKVRERSPLRPDFPRRVSFQYSPFDPPIFAFEDAFCSSPRRRDEFPEHAEFIPQYVLSRVLAEHVASDPLARIDFDARLVSLEQHADHVRAGIDTPKGFRAVTCRYLVGADGARSTVRKQLGIAMTGTSDIAKLVTLILRIPGLNEDPDLYPSLFHWIVNPQAPCFLGPMDGGDLWFFGTAADHGSDTESLLAQAHKALGRSGRQVDVVTRDDWTVHSLIARKYRDRRVFLIGDACHLHSPFGGHGMNLGIADAVDLGWKLAARLEGWGTEGLLDSYEIERRQAHELVIDSATRNVQTLSEHFADPDLARRDAVGEAARALAAESIETTKAPEFRSLGLVLGYRYRDSPALGTTDASPPPLDITTYRPCARPGHLAPHAWIDETTSLYDLFDRHFTLLVLDGDAAGAQAVCQEASRQGVPCILRSLNAPDLTRLYAARFALVRPDQHIAWSGNSLMRPDQLVAVMRGDALTDRKVPA